MIYMFVYPLFLGLVPCIILHMLELPMPSRCYQDGVLIITIGSCLRGILEIYGTTSPYTRWYLYIGLGLLVIGSLQMLRKLIKS